ncbi:MAG: GAF domain-containing protein [Vicinamibacterales bacterium]
MKAAIPTNEARRLQSLHLLKVLDTQAEDAFDELTRLAAAICGTPMSAISLIDADRQWFKSRVGVEAAETPREIAFCAHAILEDEVLVVNDATKDPRFNNNPMVTGDPSIRFYAGAPLVVDDGQAIGTLCVIDRTPRHLTDAQLDALRVLRRAIVAQLQLRRAVQDLELLQQLLPMCAWCRNVRGDDGSWQSLHDYVKRTGQVTHGICPSCEKAMD